MNRGWFHGQFSLIIISLFLISFFFCDILMMTFSNVMLLVCKWSCSRHVFFVSIWKIVLIRFLEYIESLMCYGQVRTYPSIWSVSNTNRWKRKRFCVLLNFLICEKRHWTCVDHVWLCWWMLFYGCISVFTYFVDFFLLHEIYREVNTVLIICLHLQNSKRWTFSSTDIFLKRE